MSLSSFIHDQPVRERLYSEFLKPRVCGRPESKCKALTKHYTLVGTAFDYLARLYLQKLYPRSIREEAIAETVATHLNGPNAWDGVLPPLARPVYEMAEGIAWELLSPPPLGDGDEPLVDEAYPYPFLRNKDSWLAWTIAQAYSNEVLEIVNEAKAARKRYVSGSRVPVKKLAELCLKLAQIDPIYRAGRPDPFLGDVDSKDADDLVAMFHLFKKQEWLRQKKTVILNPSFGKASRIVGGADADLILDDLLVEIKCLKHREFLGPVFHQLLGYYILSTIGGVGKPPRPHVINRIGVYYARHGELLTFPVRAFIPEEKLPNVQKWFWQLAKQYLKRRPSYFLE